MSRIQKDPEAKPGLDAEGDAQMRADRDALLQQINHDPRGTVCQKKKKKVCAKMCFSN